eukprot:m.209636 g.209636  ORF g.209636 m.209636 type:complete len:830 (+) comp15553_c0_seq7:491-2980(+)
MSMCGAGTSASQTIYTSRRNLNGTYTSTCSSIPVAQNATCPPNYAGRKVTDTFNTALAISRDTTFCTADNCMTVYGSDCTKCINCLAGFSFVSDGSCQLHPSLTGTFRLTTGVVASLSVPTFNVTLQTGQATASATLTLLSTARGRLSGAVGNATIASTTCTLNNAPISNLSGLFSFPVGVTVFRCTTTDTNSLQASLTTTVTVSDAEAPRLTCLSVVQTQSSINLANLVSASDNVGVTFFNCSSGTLTFAPNSINTVVCVASDAASNNATCTSTITIMDLVPPVVLCGANTTGDSTLLQFNTSTGLDTSPPLVRLAFNATDNVGVVSSGCSVSVGTNLPLGTTNIACSARDAAGLISNCSYTVTVSDVERPTITCPSFVSLGSVSGGGAVLTTAAINVSASDNALLSRLNCSLGSSVVLAQTSKTLFISNVASFPVGITPVTCTAADTSNNTRSCSFTVTVTDSSPPSITCPLPIVLDTQPGRNFSTTNFTSSLIATDNVAVASTTCSPAGTLNASFMYPAGNTVVICQAFDIGGLSSTCSFHVTVNDNQPPIVQCPQRTVTLNTTTTANISIALPLLNATDNVRVNSTRLTIVENNWPNTTRIIPSNSTSVILARQWSAMATFQATDTSGWTVFCTFGISVFSSAAPVDTTPPVILNCPTPFVLTTAPTSNYDSYNSSVYIYCTTSPPSPTKTFKHLSSRTSMPPTTSALPPRAISRGRPPLPRPPPGSRLAAILWRMLPSTTVATARIVFFALQFVTTSPPPGPTAPTTKSSPTPRATVCLPSPPTGRWVASLLLTTSKSPTNLARVPRPLPAFAHPPAPPRPRSA